MPIISYVYYFLVTSHSNILFLFVYQPTEKLFAQCIKIINILGKGVSNVDFILYVSAEATEQCVENVAGQVSHSCSRSYSTSDWLDHSCS
jgi:hypothetical protein